MKQIAYSSYGPETCTSNYQNIKPNLSTEDHTELKIYFGAFFKKTEISSQIGKKKWKHAITPTRTASV